MAEDQSLFSRDMPRSQKAALSDRHTAEPDIATPVEKAAFVEPHFDESSYLQAFPDIASAVDRGYCASGLAHYQEHGRAERRLFSSDYQRAIGSTDTQFFPVHSVDQILVTECGHVLVEGWIDDKVVALEVIRLFDGTGLAGFTFQTCRHRRLDVEAGEPIDPGQRVGFWALLSCPAPISTASALTVSLGAGAYRRSVRLTTTMASVDVLRTRTLSMVGHARQNGVSIREFALQLAGPAGEMLGRIGVERAARHVAGDICSRFGRRPEAVEMSVIVRLQNTPHSIFLQAALFSQTRLAESMELIYVLDNPDLIEHVSREASMSATIYGIAISVVLIPARVGFAASIGAGVGHSSGSRLLLIDQQVFPERPDWFEAHQALLAERPADEIELFGVAIYSSGGANRRAVVIEIEDGLAATAARSCEVGLLTVSQRALWAPMGELRGSRTTTVVSEHIVSIDRGAFLRHGGFDTTFWSRSDAIADFCLRYSASGSPVWEHPLPLAYLPETETTPSTEEAANAVLDRCLLTSRWLQTVRSESSAQQGSKPLAVLTVLRPWLERSARPQRLAARMAGAETEAGNW